MQDGISARTMSKKLSALRSLYHYLMRTGRVEKNPLRLLRNPKVTKPLPTFLKSSEVNRLFDDVTFPDTYEGHRDRTILLTFCHTGVRVSELTGLQTSDVDTSSNELKVTGKRNKQRIIPFGNELREALGEFLKVRSELTPSSGTLFLTSRGGSMTSAQVQRIVNHYLSMVTTQKKKSPHVLRHTFATLMLNNGADLEAIKELLGHESVSTTEVYTHTTFAELKKTYQQAHPRA